MLWYQWIFLNTDELPGVTIYFLSKRNSTSPRFFPLYENTSQVRIVLVNGSHLPYLDYIYLRFLRFFLVTFKWKFAKYKYFFCLDIPSSVGINTNQILQIDDPSYSQHELHLMKQWESNVKKSGFSSKIIVTTSYMKNYFEQNGIESSIEIISQGFSPHKVNVQQPKISNNESAFKLVFISPYIDTAGDPHAGHHMWDSSILLDEIWPSVNNNRDIELHLIGRTGRNATKKLQSDNVFLHGFMSITQVSNVLPSFDLALYPRMYDNRWQPQKLVEYMGAVVPTLAFDLNDTKIIRDLSIGMLVNSAAEFISSIFYLNSNRSVLENYRLNCLINREKYTWRNLGQKLDRILENSESL